MALLTAPYGFQQCAVQPMPGLGLTAPMAMVAPFAPPALPSALPSHQATMTAPAALAALQCLQQQQQQQQQQQALSMAAMAPQQPVVLQALQQAQLPMVPAQGISTSDLLAAVESLYRDQLRPYGRILRKRLAEMLQAAGRNDCEVGVKELRLACDACPWMQVEDADGAEWAALIMGRQADFVDVYSPDDVYPKAMWAEASLYFGSLTDSAMVLPGGRYSCAQVLMQRRLPFLASCTLGQVCHIVQLAISQKKLLGYLNGTVVPYAKSQSMIKDKHAECQRPCAGGGARARAPVASFQVLRRCLEELVGQADASNTQPVPLSNIKRLFRSKFNVELSETALGYAKVSELLQDQRFNDLCEVKLQGHGYVMVPVRRPVRRNLISLADSLCVESSSDDAEPAPSRGVAQGNGDGNLLRKRGGFIQPLCMDEINSDDPSPTASASQVRSRTLAAAPAIATTPFLATTPARGGCLFPPTPSPNAATAAAAFAAAAATMASSTPSTAAGLPRLLGAPRGRPGHAFPGDGLKCGGLLPTELAKLAAAAEAVAPTLPPSTPPPPGLESEYMGGAGRLLLGSGLRSRRPSGEQPLYEQPGDCEASSLEQPWKLPPLTPSTLGTLGFGVHNTFIHAALPPPTPVKTGSHHRARSLPRDTF